MGQCQLLKKYEFTNHDTNTVRSNDQRSVSCVKNTLYTHQNNVSDEGIKLKQK